MRGRPLVSSIAGSGVDAPIFRAGAPTSSRDEPPTPQHETLPFNFPRGAPDGPQHRTHVLRRGGALARTRNGASRNRRRSTRRCRREHWTGPSSTIPLATDETPSCASRIASPSCVTTFRRATPERLLGVVHPGLPAPAKPGRRRAVRPAIRSRCGQVPHGRLPQAGRSRVAARPPPGRDPGRRGRTYWSPTCSTRTATTARSPSTSASPSFASCATTRSPPRLPSKTTAHFTAAIVSGSTPWPRMPMPSWTSYSSASPIRASNSGSWRTSPATTPRSGASLPGCCPIRRRRWPRLPPLGRQAYETRLARLAAARSAIALIRDEGLPEMNIPPEAPTWWGSLNAVTAWVDHVQVVEGSRYAHAMFGAGDRLKTRAHELAITEART